MNGQIVERDAADCAPVSLIVGGPTAEAARKAPTKQNMGFPSSKFANSLAAPTRRSKASSNKATAPAGTSSESAQCASPTKTESHASVRKVEEDEQIKVSTDVASMSAAERAAAVDEIEALLSPEAVAILRRRAAAAAGGATAGANSSTSSLGAESYRSRAAKVARNGPSTRSPASGNSAPPHRSSRSRTAKSGSNPGAGSLATNLEELREAQKDAPADVQAALAWSALEDAVTAAEAEAPGAGSTAVRRYDLQGAQLLRLQGQGTSAEGKVDQGLQLKMVVALQVLGLSEPQAALVAAKLVSAAIMTGICADSSRAVPQDTQPQHPLLQHERDGHLPGYTLGEACELMRSSETHQRCVGAELVCGVLVRRSAVLALEPYAGRRLYQAKEALQNNLTKKYGVDTERLKASFTEIVDHTVQLLQESYEIDTSPYSSHVGDVRRVIGFVFFQLTSTDLPLELPTVILWSFRFRSNSSWLYRVSVIHCLLFFCSTESEMEAAAQLWGCKDGCFGVPPLPSPHGRRPEVTYEQGLLDAVLERQRVEQQQVESEKQAEDAGAAADGPSSAQTLALACRHCAVDGLVEAGVVHGLSDHLRDSLRGLGFGGNGVVSVSAPSDSETSTSFSSGLISISQAASVAIFQCLAEIARNGNRASVYQVIVMLRQWWTSLGPLLEVQTSIRFPQIQDAFLQTLTECARRDMAFCAWLGGSIEASGMSIHPVPTSLLALLLSRNSTCSIWLYRLWRAMLLSQQGLNAVGELWLARSGREDSGGTTSVVPWTATWQAAVELSHVLNAATAGAACVVRKYVEQAQKQEAGESYETPELLSIALETLRAVVGFAARLLAELRERSSDSAADDGMRLFEAAVQNLVATLIGESPVNSSKAQPSDQWQYLRKVHESTSLQTHFSLQHLLASSVLLKSPLYPRVESILVECDRIRSKSRDVFYEDMGSAASVGCVNQNATDCTQLELRLARNRLRTCLEKQPTVAFWREELEWVLETMPDPPGVSAGLYCWQRHRTLQMLILNCVSNLSRSDAYYDEQVCQRHWNLYSQALGRLSHGMISPIQALLRMLTRHLATSLWSNQTEGHVLAETVMTSLLGQHDTSLSLSLRISRRFIQYGGCDTEEDEAKPVEVPAKEGSGAHTELACTDWILDVHRQQLPLSGRWPLKALFLLRGSPFCQWLQILHSTHGVFLGAASMKNDAEVLAAPLSNKDLMIIAGDLYRLLRLSSAELCYRWLPENASAAATAALDTPPEAAVDAFTHLLLKQAVCIAKIHNTVDSADAVAAIVSEASQESVLSARGVLAAHDKRQRVSYLSVPASRQTKRTAASPMPTISEEGLLELAGKLLEAALAQQLGADIHGSALAVLTCPQLVPWRVQERVWRELGEMGLVLLLDPSRELWAPLLVECFVPGATYHHLVAQSICSALGRARGGAKARQLVAYHMGCQIICCCLFGRAAHGFSEEVYVVDRGATLLNHLLAEAPHILPDVLSMLAAGGDLARLYTGIKGGSAERGAELLDIWSTSLGLSPESNALDESEVWSALESFGGVFVKSKAPGGATLDLRTYVSSRQQEFQEPNDGH